MEQRKRPRPSTALRRAIMARFAESGLSVEAFCQRESISTSSFYRWRSLLGDSSPREVATPSALNAVGRAAAFVELGTLPPASRVPVELHLDLGGGVLLHAVRG
ncbi:MAG: transposase [Gammaproteobacteria bacterium]|nr:transposase [Gammaproteobacteria bacterium]